MPLFSFEGLTPQVHPTAFVAPTATLVGDVIVEEGASIWYGAVIRADYAPVIVRRRANVQDNAVIHGPPGLTTDVGPGATVAHNCVVHGAMLERGVHRRQRLGRARRRDDRRGRARRRGIGGRRGRDDPGGMLAAGSPAVVRRPVKGSGAEMWVELNPGAYAELAQRHRRGIAFVDRDVAVDERTRSRSRSRGRGPTGLRRGSSAIACTSRSRRIRYSSPRISTSKPGVGREQHAVADLDRAHRRARPRRPRPTPAGGRRWRWPG